MTTGLHNQVLDELGAFIAGGGYEGEVFRIEQLESRFGVSRSVIREALRVLESMNVVSSRRSVGVIIKESSEWNPFDPAIIRWRLAGRDRLHQLQVLGELRFGVEPVAAMLAADRATPENCGSLTEAVIGMSTTGRSGDLDAYLQHDILFHTTLLNASGNAMFASLAPLVAEVLTARTEHHLMPSTPNSEAVRLHIEVADAVRFRDTERARESMEKILSETKSALLEIERSGTEAPSSNE